MDEQVENIVDDNSTAPETLDAIDAVVETEAGNPVEDIKSVEDTPVYSPEAHLSRMVELLEGILARTGATPASEESIETEEDKEFEDLDFTK